MSYHWYRLHLHCESWDYREEDIHTSFVEHVYQMSSIYEELMTLRIVHIENTFEVKSEFHNKHFYQQYFQL